MALIMADGPITEGEVLNAMRGEIQDFRASLDQLNGKKPVSLVEAYVLPCLVTILVSIDGFVRLREIGAIRGSRMLVRPAIEATFNAEAARKDPSFLFRKGYSEILEDSKFKPKNEKDAFIKDHLGRLEEHFKTDAPKLPRNATLINVWEIAKAAGLTPIYERHYRLFCQYTHGSIRATLGNLPEATEAHETPFMRGLLIKAQNSLPLIHGQ